MTAAIDVKTISFAYGQELILRDLSFSVLPGEFFIIIGPNGSGKTTLLKTMAGLHRAREGRIRILNRDIRSYPGKQLARQLAVVPQNVYLQTSFTVLETVLMGRYPYHGLLGMEDEQDLEAAENAMQATRVSHLQDRTMDQLSGGEQQRTLIARALCQEPEILLLDEPISSLDLAHQGRIMDLLERLQKEKGITVVMIAHDLNLAALYGHRVLLLNRGKLVCLGSPKEVLTFEQLEEVFGCTLLVDESSLDGLPRITMIPGRYLKRY